MNTLELFLSINNIKVLYKFNDVYTIQSDEVSDIGEVSDGYHTFNSLYEQRLVLFAALCNTFNDKAWKSHRHSDGLLCFEGGWFVVGITTPEGNYTYHYEDKHWDLFKCKELKEAPVWDGHTDKDINRILSLNKEASNECCE